jgi:hypothetical protein
MEEVKGGYIIPRKKIYSSSSPPYIIRVKISNGIRWVLHMLSMSGMENTSKYRLKTLREETTWKT